MVKAHEILNRADQLFSSPERVNTENIWEELAEFMLNNQYGVFRESTSTSTDLANVNVSTAGAKRTRRVFDSTALQAVQELAAAFQGTLTNPATTWSKLRFQDMDLNDNEEAVNWLEEVNGIMHNKFNESNFNTEIAKGYQSFVAFGTMVLFHEEDDEDMDDDNFGGFRFTSMHMAKVAISENKKGFVDTIMRKFELTARQAIEKFGNDVHHEIQKAAIENPEKTFSFVHAIFPRDKKDVKVDEKTGLAPGNKRPIASIYVDASHNVIVKEDGYYDFPVYSARWSLMPGERYGRGPGHLALPDTRTLNKLKMRGLEAIDLQVRPPLLANQRDVFGQLDMRPGQISIVKNHEGIREFVSQARSDILQFSVEELKDSIKSIFFLDKLLLPPRTETGEMTAFEVSQRVEQMQRVLGPVLSRLNHELLNPLVVRSFKMLSRAGQLPEMPDILRERGVNVEIVFVNQLARAQQMQDVSAIQQWVNNLGMLAQLNPEVIDVIDADGIAKHTARILGVPEVAVKSDAEVQDARDQRAEQQQQMADMEQGSMMADAMSKLQK